MNPKLGPFSDKQSNRPKWDEMMEDTIMRRKEDEEFLSFVKENIGDASKMEEKNAVSRLMDLIKQNKNGENFKMELIKIQVKEGNRGSVLMNKYENDLKELRERTMMLTALLKEVISSFMKNATM